MVFYLLSELLPACRILCVSHKTKLTEIIGTAVVTIASAGYLNFFLTVIRLSTESEYASLCECYEIFQFKALILPKCRPFDSWFTRMRMVNFQCRKMPNMGFAKSLR